MPVSPLFAVDAEELLAQGKAQEAIDLVQEGLAEYPKYASAFGILAKAYKMVGNELDANEILESAVYSFPQSKTLKAILDPSSLRQPQEFNIKKAVAFRSQRFKTGTETPIETYFTDEVLQETELKNELINSEYNEINVDIHFDNENDEIIEPTYINVGELTNDKLSQSINSKTYSLIPYPKNIPEFYFSNSNGSLFNFIEYPYFELPKLVDSYDNIEESNSGFLDIDDSIETYNTILANRDLLDDEIDFDTINFNNKNKVEKLETSKESEMNELDELDNSILAYNSMLKYEPTNQNIDFEEKTEIDDLNDTIETYNTILANKDILEIDNFENKEIDLIEKNEEESYYQFEKINNSDTNEKVTDVFQEIIKADVDPRMSLKDIGEGLSEFSNDDLTEIKDLDDFATETLADIYIEQGAYQDAIDIYYKLILMNPENSNYYEERIELINQNL